MGVTSVQKDPEALTMTVTAEYDVDVARAWQLWADPRQLERWWGPPTYPATVEDHELRTGGRVTYFMTSPEGEKYHGWWLVQEVEPPVRLVVQDGFAHADGTPNSEMPMTVMDVRLAARDGGGVVITMVSEFASLEQLEQLVAMGMEEGLQAAMSQIDGVLAG